MPTSPITDGKWQIYMFSLDWLMLVTPLLSAAVTPRVAPLFNAADPTITRMYAHPPFARAYWRAVQNAIRTAPWIPANCNPVIDAKSKSLFANGIAWCDGQALTTPQVVRGLVQPAARSLPAIPTGNGQPAFAVNSKVTITNDLGLHHRNRCPHR